MTGPGMNLFWYNPYASWDSTIQPTWISSEDPQTDTTKYTHHRGADIEGDGITSPDVRFDGTDVQDVPTPIRISVTGESPFQPQDLPIVAMKMFQPKSGKATGIIKLTSPDVHTFIVPEQTFL